MEQSPPQIPEIALPSGKTLAAGIESPLQAITSGQTLPEAFGARMDRRNLMATERPGATFTGEIGADVAALAALRAPARAGNPGGAFDRLASSGANALTRLAGPNQGRGVRAFLGSVANSDAFRSVLRGSGRVLESAGEGALIGELQNGSPEDLALLGAGTQAAGSVANTMVDRLIGGAGFGPKGRSLTRAGATVLTGSVLLSLLKEAPPLDQDQFGEFLNSIDSNFEKVATMGLMGLGVGLLGRRGSSNAATLGKFFPTMADALSTIPRAGLYEVVREAQNDSELAKAMSNVPALGESDAKRFMSILEGDQPVRGFRAWMNSNERVNRILNAPDPRLANVPLRNSDG